MLSIVTVETGVDSTLPAHRLFRLPRDGGGLHSWPSCGQRDLSGRTGDSQHNQRPPVEDLAFLALVGLVVGHVRIAQPRDHALTLDRKAEILRRIRLKSPGSVEYLNRYEREILAVGADLFAVGRKADPDRLAHGFERGLGYRAATLQRNSLQDARRVRDFENRLELLVDAGGHLADLLVIQEEADALRVR